MSLETTEFESDVAIEESPPVPEAFCVRDDGSANWVVRRILECRAYAKRCGEWCQREQARAKHDEEFFLFRYEQQLIDFARRKLAEERGRRKSLNLPAGTIGFRKEASKLVVDDEAAVIAWAKRHKPELIRTIEHLSKSALNEHVENTGEIPEAGVHIQQERETFYVR